MPGYSTKRLSVCIDKIIKLVLSELNFYKKAES